MKIDRKKRYFDSNDDAKDQSKKKLTVNKMFKNERKQADIPNTENTTNSEVEVYNIKVTPRMLKGQIIRNNIRANNSIRGKKQEKFPGQAPIDPERLEHHSRGEGIGAGVRHPLYAEKLKRKEKKFTYAQEQAARAEILLTEEQGGVEVDDDVRTTTIHQRVIAENVDIAAASKIFELDLEFGPYRAKYSRNGRHLLLGSKKGHLAAFDWLTKKLHYEINVMESIHDISWLHIETMMAVAQKEWLYIYDNTGTEIHCVKRMDKILRMEFLPYHFLLAAVNEYGFMSWLDISIGEIVGHYKNHMGRSTVMAQNPYNATLCLGNAQGVVSLWAPTVNQPLAKILCHMTPLTSIAVDSRGMYMATAGVDRSMKIWDIRNLDGPVQNYRLRSPAVELDFSQRGMLAVGLGDVVEIYNDCCTQRVKWPYMRHRMAKSIGNFNFCPYEDVLGIGTSKGFTSIIIPGSGEPNFDALESNPFQNKTQRREAEVKALLEKIPAELITLNPFEVTEVDVPSMQEQMEAKKSLLYLKPRKVDVTPRRKNKGKTVAARKKIIKQVGRQEFVQQTLEAQKLLDLPEKQKAPKQSFGVLDRFVSKK